jgi:hypothetical protein
MDGRTGFYEGCSWPRRSLDCTACVAGVVQSSYLGTVPLLYWHTFQLEADHAVEERGLVWFCVGVPHMLPTLPQISPKVLFSGAF